MPTCLGRLLPDQKWGVATKNPNVPGHFRVCLFLEILCQYVEMHSSVQSLYQMDSGCYWVHLKQQVPEARPECLLL